VWGYEIQKQLLKAEGIVFDPDETICFNSFFASSLKTSLRVINVYLDFGLVYLGCAIPLWVLWQIGTVIGVIVGMKIPESWSLDFAVPLTFMAIMLPNLRDLAADAAALTSGFISVIAFEDLENWRRGQVVRVFSAVEVPADRRLQVGIRLG